LLAPHVTPRSATGAIAGDPHVIGPRGNGAAGGQSAEADPAAGPLHFVDPLTRSAELQASGIPPADPHLGGLVGSRIAHQANVRLRQPGAKELLAEHWLLDAGGGTTQLAHFE